MAQMPEKKATDHLYWARSSSTGAAPPPKPISADEAKKMQDAAGAGGSAWNKGGNTWEEKRINQWTFDLLKETLLPELAFELPGAAGAVPSLPRGEDSGAGEQRCRVRVLSADSVTGECTYVLSRGKQRVVFELQIKLQVCARRSPSARALAAPMLARTRLAQRRRTHRARVRAPDGSSRWRCALATS